MTGKEYLQAFENEVIAALLNEPEVGVRALGVRFGVSDAFVSVLAKKHNIHRPEGGASPGVLGGVL